MFILWYCDTGGQIVYTALYLCFHLFFTCTVGYLRKITIVYIVTHAVLILMSVLFMCLLGMLIIYIMELQSRLFTSNVENIKLLDGMHEGLLILSKDGSEESRRVMFINNPV